MNKTILLELTEKEVEVMANLMETGWLNLSSETPRIEKENMSKLANSIQNKVKEASQPQQDVLVTASDLFLLISSAKEQYRHLRADLHLSRKRVDESDFKHISLASAVIMWLNGKNLLKRVAKFDFTDLSSQYEEDEE